ncbi:MAG TPA: cytochrome c [Bacteroidales bacterium]|nr:cytochrome c [Bacteroidales bacterium]HRZ77874.1 cytochrome c [Bacteroidales bacterium]
MKKYILLLALPFFLAACGGNAGSEQTTDQTTVEEAPAADQAAAAVEDPVERGRQIFEEKICITCHSLDGSKLVGPSIKGIYGKTETVITGGKERQITIDDEYIKRSILEPDADLTKGYTAGQMVIPPPPLTDEEIAYVIEYIKTIK